MLGLVAGPVIEAIARLEFEDGLRTGWLEDGSPPWRLLVPLWWLHLTQINSAPPGGYRLVIGAMWLSKRTPVRPNSNSAEFRAWVVLNYSSYVVLGLNWP